MVIRKYMKIDGKRKLVKMVIDDDEKFCKAMMDIIELGLFMRCFYSGFAFVKKKKVRIDGVSFRSGKCCIRYSDGIHNALVYVYL